MRLIDADALIKGMGKRYNEKAGIVPDNLAEGFLQMEKLINDQPTAYDAEAVIDELEYLRAKHEGDMHYWAEHDWKDNACYNECILNDRQAVCFEQAIGIVKKGGVE